MGTLFGNYRLIAPDLAGFGLSPASTSEFSLSEHARSVLNAINELAIERLTVVGVSAGGYVALHLVEELDARLQGLVLVNTSIALDSAEIARWRHELAAETELEGVEIVADELLPKMLSESRMQFGKSRFLTKRE